VVGVVVIIILFANGKLSSGLWNWVVAGGFALLSFWAIFGVKRPPRWWSSSASRTKS